MNDNIAVGFFYSGSGHNCEIVSVEFEHIFIKNHTLGSELIKVNKFDAKCAFELKYWSYHNDGDYDLGEPN